MTASTRPIGEVLRTLAGGDPSVALVASMHPSVLGFWLRDRRPGTTGVERAARRDLRQRARRVQWGTITSEPGSGGDILRTRSIATRDDDGDRSLPGAAYRVTGDKHFGSGSGVTVVHDHERAPGR